MSSNHDNVPEPDQNDHDDPEHARGAMSNSTERADDGTIIIRTTEEKLQAAERRLLEIQNLNDVPLSLKKFSQRASVFQFVQCAVLFYFAATSDSKWCWYTNYPSPGSFELNSVPLSEQVACFSILWYSPIFIMNSGIQHFCCCYFRDTYEWYVARHQNPFRWTEYTFSASLMKVMIAQTAGITDIHLLLCCFVLTAICIQAGATHESVNAKARADGHAQNWRPFMLSWIGELTSWYIIFNYFGIRASKSSQPAFVWVVVIVQFLLNESFAILFTLQWMKIPPFDDYVTGEKAFITLSFVAKTLLAWVSFGGTFQRY